MSFLVNLCDPVGNEHQVIVKKVNARVYFGSGWNQMGSLYPQNGRGTVRLVYIRPNKFFIKVKDRFGKEVKYPTPPCIFKPTQDPVQRLTIDAGDKYLSTISKVPTVYHKLGKHLTADDARGEKLVCFFLFMILVFFVVGQTVFPSYFADFLTLLYSVNPR